MALLALRLRLASQNICSNILPRFVRLFHQAVDVYIWLSTDVIWRVGYNAITGHWLLILSRWHLSNNVTESSDRIILYVALSFLLIVAM